MESGKILKFSDRFRTEHIHDGRIEFLLKTSLKPDLNKKIAQQVSGAQSLTELLAGSSDLRVETIIGSGENWLKTELLAGGSLATTEQFTAGQNLDVLDDYVKIAAELDHVAAKNLATTYADEPYFSSTPASQYRQKIAKKFADLGERPDLDKAVINAALDFIDVRISTMRATWQHGDLTPWHIFKDGQYFVLVDCEHVSNKWPRYFDIANFYSQLNIRFNLAQEADQMLQKFNELTGGLDSQEAFEAQVVLRSTIRMVEHHDNPEMIKRATELVKKIVQV